MILNDLICDFLNLFVCDACHSFSQLLGGHSSAVVHQVVSQSLSQIILSLMLENLHVNSSFSSLQLFVCDLTWINFIKSLITCISFVRKLYNIENFFWFNVEIISIQTSVPIRRVKSFLFFNKVIRSQMFLEFEWSWI